MNYQEILLTNLMSNNTFMTRKNLTFTTLYTRTYNTNYFNLLQLIIEDTLNVNSSI